MRLPRLIRSTPLRVGGAFALFFAVSTAWLPGSAPTPAAAQTDPAPPAQQATAAQPVGPISFSRSRTAENQPIVAANNFKYGVGEVWVTFDYSNLQGRRLSRVVRFDGEDVIYGDLPCCAQQSGRYAFRIAAAPPSSLAEGNWEVFVYVDDREVQKAGFGVFSGDAPDPSLETTTTITVRTTDPATGQVTTTTTTVQGPVDITGNGNGGNGNSGNGNDNS